MMCLVYVQHDSIIVISCMPIHFHVSITSVLHRHLFRCCVMRSCMHTTVMHYVNTPCIGDNVTAMSVRACVCVRVLVFPGVFVWLCVCVLVCVRVCV